MTMYIIVESQQEGCESWLSQLAFLYVVCVFSLCCIHSGCFSAYDLRCWNRLQWPYGQAVGQMDEYLHL